MCGHLRAIGIGDPTERPCCVEIFNLNLDIDWAAR